MKLQDFPSLSRNLDGTGIAWRKGYHRQISGQSVHVSDRAAGWEYEDVFGNRWGAYDDDTGYLIVTAPTMRACIAKCERYIAANSAFFASEQYIELCKEFLAMRKELADDRGRTRV